MTPREAAVLQSELRLKLIRHPPSDLQTEKIAGLDLSMSRGSKTGYGAIVVLDTETGETLDQAGVVETLSFPYVPGLLSFRELPVLARAWAQITVLPDVLVFDGHGYAHPRRFGLACHGGMLLGVPSVGCAKSLLVGTHGPLGEERGATAPIIHRDEVIGMALRTRARVKPVYVSIGHRMDLETAVRIVLRIAPRYREPETTRRAHRLVNAMRREQE